MDPRSAAPPDSAARRLAEACGRFRVADVTDSVDGVSPAWVAEPVTGTEIADVMRVAHEFRLAVTVRGHGTKLSWGRPPECLDLIVDLGRMDKNLQIPRRYGVQKVAGVPALLVVDPRRDVLVNGGRLFALADARHMTPQALADWLAQWV